MIFLCLKFYEQWLVNFFQPLKRIIETEKIVYICEEKRIRINLSQKVFMNNQVLVVDDSLTTRKLIGRYLSKSEYRVAFAKNGSDALKKVKSNSFDLILLDIILPDIDGFEVCRKLKAGESKDVPVIFFTVRNDIESIKKGFEVGGVDYISKPFNKEELLLRVKTHIDLKHSREKLIVAKELAEKSEKQKIDFLSNMSHEIRTPMNTIVGFSELLTDTTLTEAERKDYTKIIIQSGYHLLNIINEILENSKQENGDLSIFNQKFSLKEFMVGIHKEFKLRNTNPDVEIRLNIPDLESYEFECDKMRLQQVFDNLMSNAIKFTHKGHIEMGFSMPQGEKSKTLEFYVKDTGVGISKEKQNIIFERYGQVEDIYTKTLEGTGLGLPIAKEIIKAMGGALTLTSDYGKGSIFKFSLPYLEETSNSNNSRASEENLSSALVGNWKNKTILIADDIEVVLTFFKHAFRNTGAKLLLAKNGQEAWELFEENKEAIDLCILDVQMPVMNGLDLAVNIRKINKNIPLIAQTGLAFNIAPEDAYNAGFNDCLYKPVKIKNLQNILQKYFD
jgi:signal transduction histidine kinase